MLLLKTMTGKGQVRSAQLGQGQASHGRLTQNGYGWKKDIPVKGWFHKRVFLKIFVSESPSGKPHAGRFIGTQRTKIWS